MSDYVTVPDPFGWTVAQDFYSDTAVRPEAILRTRPQTRRTSRPQTATEGLINSTMGEIE